MRASTTLLCVAGLAYGLAAQSVYVPSNTPGTGTCNAYPFNTSDIRYQMLVTAADMGNTPALISGLAVAQCSSGEATFQQLTIKMAHLQAGSLSSTFATNLAGGAITVLDAPDYVWHATAGAWNDIDMQVPFPYNGVDNLVIEVLALGRSGSIGSTYRDGTNWRLYQRGYTGQTTGSLSQAAFKVRLLTGDASTWTFGRGCMGSNGMTPELAFTGTGMLGTTLTIDEDHAVTSLAAVLDVGFTSAGPLFPFDMALIGAPGCIAYCDATATVGVPTTATGTASFQMTVPNIASLAGAVLYCQWANLDPGANTLSITTSDYGRVILGN